MPVPGQYDIITLLGDTLNLAFTLVDHLGAPIDLSGATLKMQIRKTAGDVVKQELLVGSGLTLSGDGDNIVTVSFVVNIVAGVYAYDLEAAFSATDIRTYVGGKFTVVADITR